MTKVVFSLSQGLVRGPDDVLSRYRGYGGGDDDTRKIGAETERVYFQRDKPQQMMTTVQHGRFFDEVDRVRITDQETGKKTKRIGVDDETSAQVVEEQTSAYSYRDFGKVLEQEREIAGRMTEIAQKLGVRQSPFTNNPFVTHDQCFRNPVSAPRQRTSQLVQAFYQFVGHDSLSYTFLTSPVHCSLSYNNPNELWDIARRTLYLTPWMYLASENSGNFMENIPLPLGKHFTMMTNQRLGARGGIPEFFYKCKNGEDYIRGHVDAVLDNRTVISFRPVDAGNAFKVVANDKQTYEEYTDPTGNYLTPREMIAEYGYIPLSQFDLAESTLWPDLKICNIRNSENIPVGKRAEVRMWDAGPHQFASMVMTSAALLMDAQGGDDCDRLLEDFGFGPEPAKSEDLHRAAMKQACWHGNRFMDVPFGRQRSAGYQTTIHDFAKEVFPIIRDAIARMDARQLPRLEPLGYICETGNTDSKVIFERYKTLEGLAGFMNSYPDDLFTRPNGTCYGIMREAGELPNPVQAPVFLSEAPIHACHP